MARKKSLLTVVNQAANAAARAQRAQERQRIAEQRRLERERVRREKQQIAEAKRLERERLAKEKKRIAEAKRQEKERVREEKKKIAEAKRAQIAREKAEKARFIENNKTLADNRTFEAQNVLESMEKILNHSLSIEHTIDFNSDKIIDEFQKPKPDKPPSPQKPTFKDIPPEPIINQQDFDSKYPKPKEPEIPEELYWDIPLEPDPSDEKYIPKYGMFDFSKKREAIKRQAIETYQQDLNEWKLKKQEIIETNQQLKIEYAEEAKELKENYQNSLKDWEKKREAFSHEQKVKWEQTKQEIIQNNQELKLKYEAEIKVYEESYRRMLELWEKEKREFMHEQDILNESYETLKENYYKANPESIHHYSNQILSNYNYYKSFPQEFEIEYNPENKILIVEYQLPSLEDIPTLKEVKYIQTRDEFTEKHITKAQLNRLYDTILYQITLRTLYELYEAHESELIEAIVFNGHVNSIDPATGQETNNCILSVQANKEDFEEINLEMVEPKACFKKLKGVGSSKLHSLTAIPPVVQMKREDSRFTESYDVIDGMEEGYNLAAMDWEDFEHLIRELFERAFAESGGEVKVTQASRDGGIDAVIFDPDPLRGGKIVVQAKRYTNVVGVSAVRDLYGTLVNEGANKGILVTTSDYGPDAYKFASDKPIQLLNGGNLLHLLEQYGYKARINLQEAKQTLSKEN